MAWKIRSKEKLKKQILHIISKNYVDPKTLIPHPPVRIEQAMKEARLSIDPFKSTSEQVTPIIDKIRTILPLKSEKLDLIIKIACGNSTATNS